MHKLIDQGVKKLVTLEIDLSTEGNLIHDKSNNKNNAGIIKNLIKKNCVFG